MLHHRGNGRFIRDDWHKFREEARRTASSLDEFSQGEIVEYDLETAQIDGSDAWDLGLNEPYEREPVDVIENNPRR